MKCFERSVRLDTALCKRCPLSSVDGERHITPVVTFVSSNLIFQTLCTRIFLTIYLTTFNVLRVYVLFLVRTLDETLNCIH